MSKLISTFKIGLDDKTKADIAALIGSLDAVSKRLKAGDILPTGGLLAAMGSEAANDAPEPELKQMGQWVFEGQDEKWISAHVDSTGFGYYACLKKSELVAKEKHWGNRWGAVGDCTKLIGAGFDATNWENSAIDRETVNDVDYLSETTPEMQGMDASDIIIDEMGRDYSHNSNCLHAVVPQITQADMQLIFIKNLSETLIQRMHSMERFSEDDYHIGGTDLMTWDIVTGNYNDKVVYGVVTGTQIDSDQDANKIDIVRLRPKFLISAACATIGATTSIYFNSNKSFCTITEAELPAFRAALEACYA